MKHILKPVLVALALSSITCVTAVAQLIEGGGLIGSFISNDYFGEYHGSFKGAIASEDGPINSFEMKIFPNGYVQGGFGAGQDGREGHVGYGSDDAFEWGGRVDRQGELRARVTIGRKTYDISGKINKQTRLAKLTVKARGRTAGVVIARPERTEDLAPRASRIEAYFNIDDEDGTSFDLDLSADGSFELYGDFVGSGTYSLVRLGRDRARITLYGGDFTETLIFYYTDGDDSDEGVVYNATEGKFYDWDLDY